MADTREVLEGLRDRMGREHGMRLVLAANTNDPDLANRLRSRAIGMDECRSYVEEAIAAAGEPGAEEGTPPGSHGGSAGTEGTTP